MKKLLIYALGAFSLMGLNTSCSDFGDVNVDPENLNPSNMDYSFMFTHVQSQIAGSDWDVWRNGCIYSGNMMQQTTSVNWQEGVFYTMNEGFNAAYWDGFYSGGRAAIRNITEVMYRWKDKPKYANEYQYARVMRAYIFQRMTDLYGDVPYFEAGQQGIGGTGYPKYDTQQAIYDDLLKEMDEVNTALSGSTAANMIGGSDVIYQGNAEKWRKTANSLMLRLAMRLVKVDEEKASIWVKKAVANGLFTSNDDSFILRHDDGTPANDSAEPWGKIYSDADPNAFYMSEFFINSLKANQDPRLQMLATRCDRPDSKWSAGNDFDLGDNSDPNSLIGMPIGYITVDGQWSIKNAPNYPGANWRSFYALPNRKTISRADSPSMLITYAENCLLLAEAAHRGFIPGGDAVAKTHFENGVRAAMAQFSVYQAAKTDYESYLDATHVGSYVAARLTAFDQNPLEIINWEYYVTTFGDSYETFSNWRRSGYPALKSVYEAPYNRPLYPNHVSTTIPRRFIYPSSESQQNPTHYAEAVGRLSDGNKMTSRVWWDKQ